VLAIYGVLRVAPNFNNDFDLLNHFLEKIEPAGLVHPNEIEQILGIIVDIGMLVVPSGVGVLLVVLYLIMTGSF